MIRYGRAFDSLLRAFSFAAVCVWSPLGAQTVEKAPPGVPADATGQCRDSTYTYAASISGACSSHAGLATWWGLGRAVSKESLLTVVPSAAISSSLERRNRDSKSAQVTGTDSVWINTRSGVYHCRGTRWFGRTAKGRYSSERDAVESGARPAYGRRCSQVGDFGATWKRAVAPRPSTRSIVYRPANAPEIRSGDRVTDTLRRPGGEGGPSQTSWPPWNPPGLLGDRRRARRDAVSAAFTRPAPLAQSPRKQSAAHPVHR